MRNFVLGIVVIMIMICGPKVVFAGSYTATTPAAQDATITRVANQRGITEDQLVSNIVRRHVSSLKNSRDRKQRERLMEKLDNDNLPAPDKALLRDLLNSHGD